MKPPDKNRRAHPAQKQPRRALEWNIDARWAWLGLALVFLAVGAIYARALRYDLLLYWDDNLYVTDNSHIRSLAPANVKLLFTSFYVFNYQPLTMLTYALEHQLAGGQASVYHATSILFHLANALLVFVLIRRISSRNNAVALFAAAFFAVHPLHVESVAWVAERKDVLYAFSFLLSLILYDVYLESRKPAHLVYVAVFFLLSCLSKSAAVVLPLLLLLVDYHRGRKPGARLILEKIPFFVVSLVFGFVAIESQEGAIRAMAPGMSVIDHVAVVSWSLLSYLYKAVCPVRLSAFYAYPWQLAGQGGLPVAYYLSVPVVGLVLATVWYSRRWGTDVLFGFGFFLVTIVLVLQVTPVGGAAMADRYTYVPYVGLSFVIGQAVVRLAQGGRAFLRGPLSVVVFAGLIAFSVVACGRVTIWQNDATLFTDIIDFNPIGSAYLNRATYYQDHYAATVYSKDPDKKAEYLHKAIADYEAVLRAPLTEPYRFRVHYCLGTARFDVGDFREAVRDLDEAIRIDSTHARAFFVRGCARGFLQDYKGALADFDRVLAMNPRDAVTWFDRGTIKSQMGDDAGAVADLGRAIDVDANYADAYFNRGAARFRLRDYRGALADFSKVVKLAPQNSAAVKNRDVIQALVNTTREK
jgi:protein O-mannosyl-transferase